MKPGEHLKTPDGTLAVADGGTTPKVHDGWMWDLTVPGNNDHDFYVLPASSDGGRDAYHAEADGTSILVHNSGGLCPTNGLPHGPIGEDATYDALQKAGYTNITREVQFINSKGRPFRADFVAQNPNGDWEAFDAKTGAGSEISPNQEIGYPELQKSGVILNTDKLAPFGFNNGDLVQMPVTFDLWECPACGSKP